MSTQAADANWEKFHMDKVKVNFPQWPNEVMLKLFHGSYLKEPFVIEEGMNILDIGCGFGNNLIPFLKKGCKGFGTEVTDDIARLAQDLSKEYGYDAVIKSGHNQNIPFDDNFFDVLLSINVLHYEKTEKDIFNSMQEYCRVLKPNGALVVITVGPEHTIYKKAKPIGAHQYLIQDFDFRNGEQYFYFDNEKYLRYYMEKYFNNVETGRSTERLMEKPLDFLISFARNKK